MKKLIILICMLLTISAVSAQPVNAGFFDWVKSFFTSEEETTTPITYNDTINISIAGETFTEPQFKELINSNEQYKEYIKKFDYECFQVKLGTEEEFSMRFNLETSTIEDLSKEFVCENEIVVEQELVEQIKEEGFDGSKIKEYRKQIDVPFGVYWALGKDYIS